MESIRKQNGMELDGLDEELVEDLGRQSLESIQKLRSDARIEVKLAVTLLPGDSSRRHERALTGRTKDLSSGGCLLLLGAPAAVGDVYHLRFDDPGFRLPSLFARCLRARLIREDVFEAGFQFFTRLELPEAAGDEAAASSDLFD